jgi:hypothetical protein
MVTEPAETYNCIRQKEKKKKKRQHCGAAVLCVPAVGLCQHVPAHPQGEHDAIGDKQ